MPLEVVGVGVIAMRGTGGIGRVVRSRRMLIGRVTLVNCRHLNFNSVIAVVVLVLVIFFVLDGRSSKRYSFSASKEDELVPFSPVQYDKSADYLPDNVLTIFSILRQLSPSSTDANQVSEKYNSGLGYVSTVNAIRSWLSLSKPVSVVLFGDEASCAHIIDSVLKPIPASRP